jgi:hypothetical protein
MGRVVWWRKEKSCSRCKVHHLSDEQDLSSYLVRDDI